MFGYGDQLERSVTCHQTDFKAVMHETKQCRSDAKKQQKFYRKYGTHTLRSVQTLHPQRVTVSETRT